MKNMVSKNYVCSEISLIEIKVGKDKKVTNVDLPKLKYAGKLSARKTKKEIDKLYPNRNIEITDEQEITKLYEMDVETFIQLCNNKEDKKID